MAPFNPYTQNLTLLKADGVTPVTFTVSDVDSFYYTNAASCINYGAQLGASLLMFFIVLILVKESSRWKPIHILNILSLALSFLRPLLFALYFTDAWDEFYANFALDFSAVPRSAYAKSIAGTVIPLLLTITVNASLFLQVHTVCKRNSIPAIYNYAISALSFIVAGLAVGFRFAETVVYSLRIMKAMAAYDYAWVTVGTLTTETISIWFFSLIFTGKLVHTLYIRKRQGWKQFSAVQVLAIMGGCTMVIPSIFAILEYVADSVFPEAGSVALTMVALLLPLSSIWAGMLTNSSLPSLNLSASSVSNQTSVFSASQRKMFGSVSTGSPSSGLDFRGERKGSSAPNHSISPTTIDSVIEHIAPHPRDSTEIDLENMGVRVNRSYSVHSGKAYGGYGRS